jgi:SAM-dependent methyltransferase
VRLSDPALVQAEYESEDRLAARKAAHENAEGTDAREVLFETIREESPRRVLEVGCGEGELAERLMREAGADVVAVDQSARMVELACARGVDARLGDVQALDFPDGSFDCVVAAWMLFHVEDLDRGLDEIARVLVPGGRLVAVTNGNDHLAELHELLGGRLWRSTFPSDDAEAILGRRFNVLSRRDAFGWLVFADADAAQRYVDSLVLARGRRVPPVEGPIRARRTPAIFVAEKP